LRNVLQTGVISQHTGTKPLGLRVWYRAVLKEGNGNEGEVPVLSKNDERYLLQALEIEGVLRACLYRYTRNNPDVDELLQEVYARLLVAGSSDEPEVRSVRAFALTIARNVAFDWLRHRQVVPIELVADLEALEVLDEGEQIEEIVNSHQELAMLVKAIQTLPDRCRQVFTLRKVYGYSQKEIASRLNISENTVEQHLTKAARRCAQALFDQPISERRSILFDRFRRRKRSNDQGE
jgi:RNA polymerase sigma-70 factor (ECF subfamily)